MQAESNLLHLQRRFVSALREPIVGRSREKSKLPSRNVNVSSEFSRTANELITPSARLSAVDRLELYHRQYWYRLLDSIEEDFPGLQRLLGGDCFWRLIEAYLGSNPSRSFTLRHLGAGLADFVAKSPAIVPYPVHAEDMARLEYALCHAFEAGERAPLSPSELAQGKLDLQSHITLLALRTPADRLWRSTKRSSCQPQVTRPKLKVSRFVVVYRSRCSLYVERLSRAAFTILSAARDQVSLEEAMERVTAIRGLFRPSDAERVQKWFSTWIAREWFIRPVPRRLNP